MTMSEIDIRLSIIDPNFESAVLKVLAESNIECHGRYLSADDVPLTLRARTLLITSNDAQQRREQNATFSAFAGVIPVTENVLADLPTLIRDAYPRQSSQGSRAARQSSSLVKGVIPRVGARTLNELIERNFGEGLFAFRKQNSHFSQSVLCTEVDDTSLASLFSRLDEFDLESDKLAVIINKLPHNTRGRRKYDAVERELRALSIQLVLPIYFDGEIQVTGVPGKQTIRSVQPLFDWIANSK